MKQAIIVIIVLMLLSTGAWCEESDGAGSANLTLGDYVQMVVEQNNSIIAQRLEFMISRDNVLREQSTFEPEFVNSYQRSEERIKYSQDQKSQLLFASEADELTDRFNALVQGKIPTGADVKVGFTENAYEDRELNEDMQYKTYLGIEITQPLMKNAGAASSAGFETAKKDAKISFQAYRKRMIEVTYSALASCWDYFGARERVKIRQDSLEVAEKLLNVNKERVRLGKMAQSELMEAESGVAVRKSWEAKARQELVSSMNNVRSYISVADVDQQIDLNFSETLDNAEISPEFGSSMQTALGKMPDYLSSVRKIDKEKLLISYAKNQRWPQLDLNGSYGLNGLGDSASDSIDDAFDSDYRTWRVGLTLTIPLAGDLKSRGELAAAKSRKRQALLELKSVEVQIANIIDTAVKGVYATREQLTHFKKAREVEEKLLEIEVKRFQGGKSTSRYLLEKENDLHYAREAELDSLVNNQKAVLSLALAEGSLLDQYGVDVNEDALIEELNSGNSIEVTESQR